MACDRRSQRRRVLARMARREVACTPVCDLVQVGPASKPSCTDLVITPHPLTVIDRSVVQGAQLLPGETLVTFLGRHGVDLSAGDWAISIGGAQVPRLMWHRVRPRHGHLIECRRVAGKTALKLVALVALTYFTLGAGAAVWTSQLGLTGFAAYAAGAAAFMVGAMVINKLLPPPKARAPQYDSAPPTYSIAGGRNRLRPYEPLALVFGEVRAVPDFVSQPFTWFEGDDQYQYVRLHAGINCGEVSELKIGTTAIESFDAVTVAKAGFPGTTGQLLDWSNVDTISGATLESPEDDSGPGEWVARTSSADTVKLAIDINASLYRMSDSGGMEEAQLQFDAQYRAVPDGPWLPFNGGTINLLSKSTKPVRRTYESPTLPAGIYEVRARKVTKSVTSASAANTLDWLTLKSYQLDSTDYSSHPHVGIRIKATGQLSGALDEVSWLAKGATAPVWTTSGWVDTPGTRNPGAHILRAARGIYDDDGRLMAGMGLPDSQIDVEGLKAFMLHCTEKGYTFDFVFTNMVSCGDLLEAMAAAGLGSISYHPGRLSVVWARDDQPIEAIVNMGNIKRGSFRVDYATRESAEEIEIAYVDRDDGWRDRTLRIKAPGVTMPRDTARLAPLGVTSAAGALRTGRFTMAQNIYQRKSVTWDMDLEHLTFRRWSLIALSHDMTQWGSGGRLHSASSAGGVVTLVLDAAITPYPTAPSWYVGLRAPGAQGYLVLQVQPFADEAHTLTLAQAWPEGVAMPGTDGPAHDWLWIFDFKAQPGQRLRVTSIEPANNLSGARITAVPEGPEFWQYVATGQYEAPPLPPAIAPLVASNVQVTQDRLGLNYDARSQLTVTFDVSGPYDHAQVWGALSGHTLELLGETRTRRFGDWTIDLAGNYDVEVRPFDALGRPGQVAGLVYTAAIDPLKSGARFIKLRSSSIAFRVPRSGSGVVAPASITINLDRGGAGLVAAANWVTIPPAPLSGTGDERSLAYADMPGDSLQVNVSLEQDGKLYIDSLTILKLYDGLDAPGSVIDPTPPPMVANFRATAGLASVFAEWDAPTYTVGHGPGKVRIYGKRRAAGDPLPEFDDAVVLIEPTGSPGAFPSDPRTTWHLWAKHVSADGYESTEPAGGQHGVVVTTTMIGTEDLGDLVVQARNLADGSLTPSKLLVNIGGGNLVRNSSFENYPDPAGMPPLWNMYASTSAARVAGRRGGYAMRVTFGGGARTWGKGIGAVWGNNADWLPGKTYIVSFWCRAQFGPGGYPMNLRFNVGPVGYEDVLNPLPTSSWQRYAFRITWGASVEPGGAFWIAVNDYDPGGNVAGWAEFDDVQVEEGDVLTAYAPRPDEILPGTIGETELGPNSVTSEKMVAGSVVARHVKAAELDASKLVISSKSLVLDPLFRAGPDYWGSQHAGVYPATNPVVPAGCPAAWAAVFTGRDNQMRDKIPVVPGEHYKLAVWVYRHPSLPGTGLVAFGFDRAGTVIQTYLVNYGAVDGWTRLEGVFAVNSDVYMMSVAPWNDQGHGGGIGSWFADMSIEKKNDFSLIVDGNILGRHFAANSIAAGTAAIGYGAIVNFMLGTGSVDDAKVSNLSAAKLTAGDGTIGGNLRSVNYNGNDQGWLFTPGGYLFARNVDLSGTIRAGAGSIGGISISGGGLAGGSFSGWGWPASGTGFFLHPYGLLLGNYNTGRFLQLNEDGSMYAPGFSIQGGTAYFSGVLQAAGGSFAGSLSAATGTFSGSLTAQAVNAVDTINLAGQAVTIPVGDSASSVVSGSGDGTYSLMTLYINSTGAPISVVCGASVRASINDTWSVVSGRSVSVTLQLLRDGALLQSMTDSESAEQYGNGNNGRAAAVINAAMPPILDRPGAGWHSYELRLVVSNTSASFRSQWSYSTRAILLLEAKR